jgi:hypothetical protein
MEILAYHVEEHCIGEEGGGPEYAPVHGGFKVWGCGSGNADDRLHGGKHGGIKVRKDRPASSTGSCNDDADSAEEAL